jgi:hypothetical protein
MLTYGGRSPFTVCINSKAGQYGSYVWVRADTVTAYVLKLQVYAGMTYSKREVHQGKQVVMVLVKPYFSSRRGITVDSFFTSEAQADKLFKTGVTTGRMHSNKPDIPQELLSHSDGIVLGIFGFTDNMAHFVCAKRKKKSEWKV